MKIRPQPTIDVHIAADGICTIDGEHFVPPPGASLHEGVLDHLRLDAAALETTVAATITDKQANYSIAIVVHPDGTSQPAATPDARYTKKRPIPFSPAASPGHRAVPPAPRAETLDLNRPYDSLPEPHRSRLKSACETVACGRIEDAVTCVDEIIQELSQTMGSRHPTVVATGVVRGDIALTNGDYLYGLQIWSFITQAWRDRFGSTDPVIIPMLANTIWCWGQLPQADALATVGIITSLIQTVNAPGSDQALQNVHRRHRQLTAVTHQQE
ncbi:hypothetical protein SAMN05216251_12739 [Actinacidiphila alni]|uniref:Uncharacterized protein n=1 Tax=Actinacidiphila alni TaxID=380248 RepID=A0A1I2LBX5_9ACTN|nr:hypothetical protein [Actinacidiphila alni]SFF74977.1 hypothetical protein SAMN05216251_12739 [Actinacidiphila alni]